MPIAILPLLAYIQAHLEGDLRMSVLAAKAGLSASHLHRVFTKDVGETPAEHVARLRLERSAFWLLVQDSSLLDIALACGYRNHETFTRAFHRHFGTSPRDYRRWLRGRRFPVEPPAIAANDGMSTYEISATRVTRLRAAHVAFIRHVGPYESVPETLFDELEDWAVRHRIPGPRVWMGIGHDAPVTTPADRLRFDAALVVPSAFKGGRRIAYQYQDLGEAAVTSHVGALSTLPAAYAAIFPRVMALPDHRLVGLPAVEIYHASRIRPGLVLQHTDICLPVVRGRHRARS